MAIRNNKINTKITVDSSGASKSTTKFFADIRKGQDSVQKGAKDTNVALGKTGKAASGAGAGGAKGFGLMGKAMGALKSSVLSLIPAFGGLAAAIAATGIGAIVIAVVALGAAMVAAVKKGAEFGKAVSDLRAISGGTNEEIAALSQQAKQLGSTTIFTASEVVNLQTELAKLGFEAREIQDATPSILTLAASLDTDLASAAAFAGAQINAFGLDASETKRIVDVMALSATTSAQDFETLNESFRKAAPAANALGVTVEETAALLGILADSNIKGSEAGTALKNSFIELKKQGLTLEQGLDKIAKSGDKLGTAIELAGKRGGPALLVLQQRAGDIPEITQAMNEAGEATEYAGETFDGVADKISKLRTDNLQGDLKGLSSAWEGFMLGIEDGTGPLNAISRLLVQGLTKTIQGATTAIAFAGFLWEDFKERTMRIGGAAVDAGVGMFKLLQGGIIKFVAKAKLAIADIPIIGAGIDVAKAKREVKKAEGILIEANERFAAVGKAAEEQRLADLTLMARFAESQKLQAIEAQAKKEARIKQEAQDQADAEAAEKAKKKAEKDAKTFEKLQEKIRKKQEDQLDKTEEEKLERKRQRQIAELDDLAVSETKKQELIKEINKLYDEEARVLAEEKKKEDEQKAEDQRQKDLQKQIEIDQIELERQLANDELTYEERLKLQEDYLDKKMKNQLDNEKLTEKERKLIEKQTEKAKNEVRKKEKKASEELQAKVLDDALNGAAESFGIAQEIGIAKMIMAAPEAISGSFKEAAKAYAPPMSIAMGALGAAGTIAPIIKGLADIKKTKFSRKSKGGSTGGNISSSAISSAAGGGGITPDAISDIASNNAARLGIDPSIGGAAASNAASNVLGGSGNQVVFSESAYSTFQAQVEFKESKTSLGG